MNVSQIQHAGAGHDSTSTVADTSAASGAPLPGGRRLTTVLPTTRVRYVADPDDPPQYAASADGSRRCWMTGQVSAPSNGQECATSEEHSARAALDLYEQSGSAALAQLDGFFTGALHDTAADALFLFGDFGGPTALFHARHHGEWLVGTNFHRLSEALGRPVDWNVNGVYDFLWGGYALLDETIDRRIKQVPAATLLTLRGLEREAATHDLPESFDCLPDDDDTHERLFATIMRAVQRWTEGSTHPALFLTGGTDSRIVLAALTRLGHRVDCVTHSAIDSVESRLAESAARLCHQPWQRVSVGERVVSHFARYANTIQRRVGPCELWGIGGMAMREAFLNNHDLLFSGLGTSITMKYAKAIGRQTMDRKQLAHTLAHAWRDPEGPRTLFPDDLDEALSGGVQRRMLAMLQRFPDGLESHQLWDLHANAQRVAKWYPGGIRLAAQPIPCVAPLCDREFSLLAMRLPWTMKARKRIGELFLRRCCPGLAPLPTTSTWPNRPTRVKVMARMPRVLSPHAYDRTKWWPSRQRLGLSAKPVAQWIRSALPPHRRALRDFVEHEMSLPLSRSAVADVFHKHELGDDTQVTWLATLIPLLLSDGFVFDEQAKPNC